ncbi:DUF551 domain-containing protein [Citrobacter werkmanii]|uniref:DUF551 domain-containing protein n=1 Tax=Citrobacter werkmanii TaxID=67827 RepID=UPI0034D6B51B
MTTNNHPANGPVSLERLYQIRQYIERNNQYQNGGNRAYILTDMLKVIDEVLEARNAEQVEFLPDNLDRALTILGVALPISKEEFNLDAERWMQRLINRVIRLESELTPPAPVVPDEIKHRIGGFDWRWEGEFNRGWNACRAAMLQAGNSPAAPDGWIPVSERMPDKLIPVIVMYADGEMWSAMWNGNRWDDGTEYPDPHSVTHWREMPAAPQQEVKP